MRGLARAAFVVAAIGSSGCALSLSGAAGLAVDSAGHVGVMTKVGAATGLELSPHRKGQRTHVSLGTPAYDFVGAFDVTGRRFGGFFGVGASGTVISDDIGGALTASAKVRLGGFAGEPVRAGPAFALDVLDVVSAIEKPGCQALDAAHSHHLAGAELEASWLVPQEGQSGRALFFVGPAYQFHGTFAPCFSERAPRRASP